MVDGREGGDTCKTSTLEGGWVALGLMDFLNYGMRVQGESPKILQTSFNDSPRWGREGEDAPFPYFGAADAAAAKSMNIHASPPYTPTRHAMKVSIWKMV